MNLPKIIQGGMGVAISNWKLANTVSREGHLGVVSGTGIGMIMAARLMNGDRGGEVRRALQHFPFQEPVQRILEKYFIHDPPTPKKPYRRPPMWTMNPPGELLELTVVANFVEVFLAKEGHENPVGINLLEKIQMPTMASLYGAMLAGVGYVIMGAGIPIQIPGLLKDLSEHRAVSYKLDVQDANRDDDYRIQFDPETIFLGVAAKLGPLEIPRFLPIISSAVLAKTLLRRSAGPITGFIIEGPSAGGHNAPSRGPVQLNENGEPIYGEKDRVDLKKIQALGLPFWLAGGYDSPEKLNEALTAGATGIQVGTLFSCCDESGMETSLKERSIGNILAHAATVRTDPDVSSTGFPFKVVQLKGSLSDPDVYRARPRLCDVGFLRQPFKRADGKIDYRCPGEPIDRYLAKGGHPEDVEHRGCLCNNLIATAGYPQHRKDGYVEPPLVTAGNGISSIERYADATTLRYSAVDVLKDLSGQERRIEKQAEYIRSGTSGQGHIRSGTALES